MRVRLRKTCRVVFDMDTQEYWVEESADIVKPKTQKQEEEEATSSLLGQIEGKQESPQKK